METKELKVTPPEGYEIDKENSTFECIKFKKKSLTYENLVTKLFYRTKYYFISSDGVIEDRVSSFNIYDSNNASSKKQLEKLLAINKLMNVAKYLNGNWKPDWKNTDEAKYYLQIDRAVGNSLGIGLARTAYSDTVYFRSRELAQQTINILGEDTIRLALSTDW